MAENKSPEMQGVVLKFNPKFSPLTKVKLMSGGVWRTGRIVDCIGTFILTVTPAGFLVDTILPDETTTRYAITFNGNANDVQWFEEGNLKEIKDDGI